MSDRLDQELLRVLRRSPNVSLDQLANEVGLPRTNFGRPMSRLLQKPVERLLDEGLVEVHRGRYRLSDRGRRTLAEDALTGRRVA
ncbi:MAG: winged helix-turn-helix transcriptional regulator [Gaiellaceae bacterium]